MALTTAGCSVTPDFLFGKRLLFPFNDRLENGLHAPALSQHQIDDCEVQSGNRQNGSSVNGPLRTQPEMRLFSEERFFQKRAQRKRNHNTTCFRLVYVDCV